MSTGVMFEFLFFIVGEKIRKILDSETYIGDPEIFHEKKMPIGLEDIQALAQALSQVPVQAHANAVSLKLPEFWTDDPEVWFARIESQFSTHGITQDGTKFDYVVSAIDNSTASEVKDILLHPPTENKYTAIKAALLAAFSKSQAEKDAELLSLSGLGDKKPSAVLRKIRSLNSDAETLRRAVFLNQLPVDVKSVLAGQNIADLDELAQAADRIMEVRKLDNFSSLHEIQSSVSCAALSKKKHPTAMADSSSVCGFHLKFGPKAHKCQPGCLFADLIRSSSSPQPSGNDKASR